MGFFKKASLLVMAVVLLCGLAACGSTASAAEQKSDKPRITSPQVSEADLAALVDGNTAFALDLYQSLKAKDGNLFYSPYSLSVALAMTYAGARGETEKQMADTLHFTLSQAKLHQAFNGLDGVLASRNQVTGLKEEERFRLNVVNAIWGQKGYKFLAEFLDVLAENYGAGMRILDYANALEESRQTINKWVSDKTENRINDLIPQGSIDEMAKLVLTNAIYFNATWVYPFEVKATADGQFKMLDGKSVTVPVMHQTESLKYAEGSGYQAVELPYMGNELSMVVLLPATGQFQAFESSMGSGMEDIIANLKTTQVTLSLPRFSFESSFELGQTLAAMGMPEAFSMAADFSGMDGTDQLYISKVLHKAFVSVDESGTEAAAASAVVIRTKGMPGDHATMTVDRPFIFLIRDMTTGTALFVGRVLQINS